VERLFVSINKFPFWPKFLQTSVPGDCWRRQTTTLKGRGNLEELQDQNSPTIFSIVIEIRQLHGIA
jgi:hypothetical protein